MLRAEDHEWVASIRTSHDPQAALLPAHFTLVFPAEVSENVALEDVSDAAGRVAPFGFVLRSIRAVRNAFGPGGHVFLVPSEGAEEIVMLHERLHRGAFQRFRRPDVPYVPHITVGASDNWSLCEALADRLGQDPRQVSGRVEAIELLRLGEWTAESARRLPLGGTGAPE